MSDDEEDDGGLWFDDGWIDLEPFHEHVAESTSQVIIEGGQVGDAERIKMTGEMLYHFTSHWFVLIRKANGALIAPAVQACHAFVAHCIECHGVPEEHQIDLLHTLVRFCALVITKNPEPTLQ